MTADRAMNVSNDMAGAVDALRSGFLVVHPTDTVYGISADPYADGGIDRIFEAKIRDRSKPIPVLVSSIEAAEQFGAEMCNAARRLAKAFWPGPLTMVLPCGDGYTGFRVPDHPVALELLEAAGGALYATSANRSGEPPAVTAERAAEVLAPHVGAVVDGLPAPRGLASTVLKVVNGTAEMLREGEITETEVQECLSAE